MLKAVIEQEQSDLAIPDKDAITMDVYRRSLSQQTHWPTEMLPDLLVAEVTSRRTIFEKSNHMYKTSDPKMKNSVQGFINEGIIFRYFYRNDDLEWGLHVDFSLRDVIPQRR